MIACRDITIAYGGEAVLSHFSLTLPERGAVCITGPSGSGKTTLLKALCGLVPISSGQITGTDALRFSMVFQEDRLLPWYTAYENICCALPETVQNKAPLAEEWLRRMELIDFMGHYPAGLSGGMQRRVALARACAYGGDVLLLDEPFKGMDDALRTRIIPRIQGAAPLIVLVTHDLSDADLLGAARIPLLQ